MGWLSHDRLGFNYRLTDLQAALGIAQLERAEALLGERARVAALYGERLAAIGAGPAGEGDPEGLVLPCADRGAERRSWFVYVVQLPEDADRDGCDRGARRARRGRQGLSALHPPDAATTASASGYREGEFPVAERVSARSLALPFFTAMGEAEVERVTAALAAALGLRAPA